MTMSSDDDGPGKGATDEGWGDEGLTRTNHGDADESDDAGTPPTDNEPQPATGETSAEATTEPDAPTAETPSETGSPGSYSAPSGGIDWADFLGDEELAAHAEDYEAAAPAPAYGDGDGGDLRRPPIRRLLASKPRATNGTEQIPMRVQPATKQAFTELERVVDDNFDDEIKKVFLTDAVVRIAALHPDEMFGMLAAYGFDLDYE